MTTSPKICLLDEETINKMAAGEVVENSSSVVKELIENSLDAGSTQICVEIQEGGRELIRITDNGCGMSKEDSLLCLERYATSKIRKVEDIEEILTMGFRGEALPSIASISKFTLLTTPKQENDKNELGTLIIVEGGRQISCTSAPRSPGTTIEVKSLFFNVPVRRKFQKSPSYDTQEISKIVTLLSLAYPHVQFELVSDQKSLLKTTPAAVPLSFRELLERRISNVLGKEYSSSLVPLHFEHPPYHIIGHISFPSIHRPNRTGQYLFINQRAVTSSLIASAVREGYGTMLPNHRYPNFVLHLHIPGSLFDVNVHPQKREVRLRQEFQLKEAIIQSIQNALRQDQSHLQTQMHSHVKPPHKLQDQECEQTHPESPHQPSNLSSVFSQEIPPFWSSYASLLSPIAKPVQDEKEPWSFQSFDSHSSNESNFSDHSQKKPANLTSQFPSDTFAAQIKQRPQQFQMPILNIQHTTPKVLATLQGYCILEPFQLPSRLIGTSSTKQEGGLFLLDQKAAYARIHYEQLLCKASGREDIQPLLIPLTMHLSVAEFQAIQGHIDLLNQMGFSLREFGESSILIDAFPSFIKQEQLQACIQAMTQDLIEMHSSRQIQSRREEQLALSACRSSLPSTVRLSLEEAQSLLQQLLQCDIPGKCPFGKMTCLYFSSEEIAKWFHKTTG